MLEYLRIRNFAIIEDAELELGPGLTVITGETGAGKSVLVGALTGLRGARLTRELVRDGAERAVLEAVLSRDSFGDLSADPKDGVGTRGDGDDEPGASGPESPSGLAVGGAAEADEDGVAVSRTLSAGGRSRQRLDGELVPVRRLAELVGPRLDISGQHEGQTLTDPSTHLALLDSSGVSGKALEACRGAVEKLRSTAVRLSQIGLDERERAARLDLLSFQLAELDAVRPEPGEHAELERVRRRLASATELETAARAALSLLYEDEGSAVERLGRCERLLSEAASMDPSLEQMPGRLVEARALCDDLARDLLSYAESLEGDPARLEEVQSRLSELDRLGRKHGVGVDELFDLQRRMAAEVEDLRCADQRIEELREELERARTAAAEAARRLTTARRRAATRLSKAVEANLARLGMDKARFLVRVEPRQTRKGDAPEWIFDGRRLGPRGWDRVELLVAPNPGEDPLPLARTASGGELSRLMLAIKLVLAHRDRVQTYVFDEVDAGIGGVTADTVGQALAEVARHRQVICITHLPGIAAFGDHHLRVSKSSAGGRTRASIHALSDSERIEELARMMGGARVTRATRTAAAELLAEAKKRCTGS